LTGVTPTHPFAIGRVVGSLPRASRLFLLWGGAAVAAYPFLPGDARSIAYVGIGLAAVVAMYAGARLRPRSRGARPTATEANSPVSVPVR